MADPRFFKNVGPLSLGEVTRVAGIPLPENADPARRFDDVASLDKATPKTIGFLSNKSYLPELEKSRAGACVVHPRHKEQVPDGMLVLASEAPYRAYARIARAFYPEEPPVAGETVTGASIDATATIGEGAVLMAGAVVGPNAEVGANCRIGPNVVIGSGVVIGSDTVIGANASLQYCLIGHRVRIYPGVCIGQRGFGFDMSDYPYVDVPQLGRVVVEDDVEIGANTTIDRGATGDTVIGEGSKLDNLVQVGHNVRVGRGCILVSQSGVAGSTVLEDFSVLAAQAGVAGHLRIGKGAQVGAAAGVMRDVPAGQKVAGAPAMPAREFFRLVAIWQRLLRTKGKSDE